MKDSGHPEPLRAAGNGPLGGPPSGGYGPPGGGGPLGPPGYGPPPVQYGPPGGYGPPPGGFGPPGAPFGPMTPQFHPLAITSMVLGILSIPTCCCGFLGAPLAIVGMVLGIVGMGKIRREPQAWKGRGMAIAGIVTGCIALLLALAALFTTFDDALKTRYIGTHL